MGYDGLKIYHQGSQVGSTLVSMVENLPERKVEELTQQFKAQNIYICCVDVIKGFLVSGPLSSPRILGKLIPAIPDLIDKLINAGMPKENIIFVNDAHEPGDAEFEVFPEHCMDGKEESEVVDELKKYQQNAEETTLAARGTIRNTTIPKYTISAFADFECEKDIPIKDDSLYIVVGCCTDLCIYSFATELAQRLQISDIAENCKVIVPETCVETFDNATHPGDFYHLLFLKQMMSYGVEVVKDIK